MLEFGQTVWFWMLAIFHRNDRPYWKLQFCTINDQFEESSTCPEVLDFPHWTLEKVKVGYTCKPISHFSYAICIRKELGFCCIEYKTCSDTGAFSIDTQDAGTETGSNCALDFLEISGGAGSCGSTVLTNRFCGAVFSAVHDSDVTGTVCGEYSKTPGIVSDLDFVIGRK